MDNSRSLAFFIASLRVFGASVLLTLSIAMFVGLYAFYGLVLSPAIERKEVAIELHRERELSYIYGRGCFGNSSKQLYQ